MKNSKSRQSGLPEGHLQIGIAGESRTKSSLRILEDQGYLRRKDTTPLSKLSESECQKILDEFKSGMHSGPNRVVSQ